MLGLAMIALLISVAANFGLTTYAIEEGKEVKTTSPGEDEHQYLMAARADGEDRPVRVDRSLDTRNLTSELPDSTFAKLKEVTVSGSNGVVSMQVLAWADVLPVSVSFATSWHCMLPGCCCILQHIHLPHTGATVDYASTEGAWLRRLPL